MSIDDYKIIKELGAGLFGTTYLVEYKEKGISNIFKKPKKYALKIEKILEKDIKKSSKSPI